MTPVSFIIIVKVINAGADTLLLVFDNLINKDRLSKTFNRSSGESFLDFLNSVEWFDNLRTPSGI
jgi:abortive infection bacteriophage resistance protein